MDTNFYGTLKFIHPIAKRMTLRRTQGRIVLVGDPNANQYVLPGFAPYACSKAALEQLAYQLRAELDVHEIKVHFFLPQPMKTKLFSEQQKQYPLILQHLLKGVKPGPAEAMAVRMLRGIQMGQFVICGSMYVELVEVLKGQSNFFYSACFSPWALLIKMLYELNVSLKMKRYRLSKHQ